MIKLKRKVNEFECSVSGEMEGMVRVKVQQDYFQFKVVNMNLSQAGSDPKP